MSESAVQMADSFKELLDATDGEIRRLLGGSMPNDAFLKEVLIALVECKNDGYVIPDSRKEYFRLLGTAAVRQFDSFDYVPEASQFIDLAVALSKSQSLNPDGAISA